MHGAAREWVQRHAVGNVRVLDIGGRNVNGTVRALFPDADYTAIDLRDGPGVDVVGDVTEYKPRGKFDVIVCCEVFEHTEKWRDIIDTALRLLRKDGTLILTAAGPGREPHSAIDGAGPRSGEWYRNITPAELDAALKGFSTAQVDTFESDVRAVAIR